MNRVTLAAIAALGALLPMSVARSAIVNIDLNGMQVGDASSAGTYSGQGALGGGTIFNGVVANSNGGAVLLTNIVVPATNLVDSFGAATSVGFTISAVGGDNEGSQPFSPHTLYDDYVFTNASGNGIPGGAPFTISGLGAATTADLFFYVNGFNSAGISINGGTVVTAVVTLNGLSGISFPGATVTGGTITGLLAPTGGVGVLSGLSIDSVPEPTSLALLGLAAFAGVARRRRLA